MPFSFGVIILFWLHAVINIYIYLKSIERKTLHEQVSRGLLSWDYDKLFQFISKQKLLLSTGVGWRFLEKSSLDYSRDGDCLTSFFLLRISGGGVLRFRCWWHCKYFIFLPESYASSPRSELWSVIFFISHFENPKDVNFQTVVFLQSVCCFFLFAHSSGNGDLFHYAQHCVYCVDHHGLIFTPNIS